MQCSRHPERTAEELCLDCQKALCLSCARSFGGGAYCATCFHPRYVRRSRIRGGIVVVGLISLCVGGYWLFESQKSENEEKARYGKSRERVTQLRSVLAGDACDLSSVRELADLLEETENHSEAADALGAVAGKCPVDQALLVRLATLQQKTGATSAALITATRLIEEAPKEAAGYGIRGSILSDRQDPGAMTDLRQAFELDAGNEIGAKALADSAERSGDGCGAADVIDELLAVGRVDTAVELRRRSDRLRKEGTCPRETVDGDSVSIPFVRDSDVMIVEVRINDRHTAKMIFDTGASSVAITSSLAERIGVNRWDGESFWVGTAGGVTRARRIKLDSVSMGGARVERVRAAIVGRMALGDGIEGLLGNSFLSRFEVGVDAQGGRITLRKRD
ncbi:MAG: clan AA aspartic protease (TIGR02281 family) [Myxococcota bacterium]|jgi:clan AA aspartic protease (TIGR02281 family)